MLWRLANRAAGKTTSLFLLSRGGKKKNGQRERMAHLQCTYLGIAINNHNSKPDEYLPHQAQVRAIFFFTYGCVNGYKSIPIRYNKYRYASTLSECINLRIYVYTRCAIVQQSFGSKVLQKIVQLGHLVTYIYIVFCLRSLHIYRLIIFLYIII